MNFFGSRQSPAAYASHDPDFELTESSRNPDGDDRDDERDDENEIPVRETSDATEAPEEFEVDDEDDLPHPEDDDDDPETLESDAA